MNDDLDITVATWNLERPNRAGIRARRLRAAVGAVDADIWILTETRQSFAPDPRFFGVHSLAHPARRPDPDERWVSIWSKWELHSLSSDQWSIRARCATPVGDILVQGVVLPYMHEPSPDLSAAKGWSRFGQELEIQKDQWIATRTAWASTPMVLAGDFNQSLDGSRWYGSTATREQLRDALAASGLTCVTTEDVVASRKLRTHHLIDHICVTDDLRPLDELTCWGPTSVDGQVLSDHPGVLVRLRRER